MAGFVRVPLLFGVIGGSASAWKHILITEVLLQKSILNRRLLPYSRKTITRFPIKFSFEMEKVHSGRACQLWIFSYTTMV